ncbi:MAG: hypothetical protein EA397_02030 [Deltaproteobacteria bacterium]|nr:MAG: hypothetical protein EA397_02030 [Deltaproteobacteria bacterium]
MPIVCLVIGASLPLALIGMVFARGLRQLNAAGAYREVAHALGLEVDTRGVSIHGVLAARPLWVGEVMVGHGPARRTEVHGVIGLRRALGLGLDIQRRRRGRRSAGLPLGHPELDRRLIAEASWAEGLQRLLDAGARAPLVRLMNHCPDVQIVDDQVRLLLRRAPSRPADLAAVVEHLELVAEALEGAREAVLPPAELEAWVEPWSELATTLDLGFVPNLPSLRGRLGDNLVEVSPELTDRGYRARVIVLFDPEETTGLLIEPQKAPDGYQFVGQDIQVEDPPFDDAFVIKGFDPEEVRGRLTDEVRRGLLELRGHGFLRLTDTHLRLSGVSGEVEVLDDVLQTVRRVADAVAPPPASAPRWIEQRS